MSILTGFVTNVKEDFLTINNSNAGIDGTLRSVYSGSGVASALQFSTSTVNINGTFTINGVAVPAAAATVTLTGIQTLTNKTITAPTISNPTVTTGTFTNPTVTTGTFTTPAITTPVFTGSITGTYTLAGTPTITNPIVSTGTFTSPTLITPALGTPTALVGTNITGTAASLTAGLATNTVSKTGTGSTYATNTSPTFVTPVIGVATGTSFNGLTGGASASDQETATSTTTTVTPAVQQRHPSASKFWVTIASGTTNISAGYNAASVARTSVGDYTLTFTTAMSDSLYCANLSIVDTSGTGYYLRVHTKTTTTVRVTIRDSGNNLADPSTSICISGFGDQ